MNGIDYVGLIFAFGTFAIIFMTFIRIFFGNSNGNSLDVRIRGSGDGVRVMDEMFNKKS